MAGASGEGMEPTWEREIESDSDSDSESERERERGARTRTGARAHAHCGTEQCLAGGLGRQGFSSAFPRRPAVGGALEVKRGCEPDVGRVTGRERAGRAMRALRTVATPVMRGVMPKPAVLLVCRGACYRK